MHLGQKWTSTLNSQLASKANGTWNCTRTKGYYGEKAQKVFLYNTNTYDPFLAVYVTDNQVTGWNSNSNPLSVWKGQTLERGLAKAAYPSTAGQESETAHWAPYYFYLNANYTKSVMVQVGIAEAYDTNNAADERTIGFHFINAARVAAGRGILKRSKYLEGVDLSTGQNLTWSGTIPEQYYCQSTELANQRYGAQAWAETMAASNKCAHSDLQKGPLGMENCPIDGADVKTWQNLGRVRGDVIWLASSKKISPVGENVATGGGESCIYSYNGSGIHLGWIFADEAKSIGLGYSNGFHCEQYSTKTE